MAWAALIAGLGYPLLLLLTDSDQLGALAGPFYVFVGTVVGAYIGFATVDDKWSNDARHKDEDHSWDSRNRGGARRRVDDERLAAQRPDRPYDR
jgi:hypothetical protein